MKKLKKIISGGETGVDRAGLDIALELQFDHGGSCPRNRRSEDGSIPLLYTLQEMSDTDFLVPTRKNVDDSDGTLILYYEKMSGGTRYTFEYAQKSGKPVFSLDGSQSIIPIRAFNEWLDQNQIETLNIAGPRASKAPLLEKISRKILRDLFTFYQKNQQHCEE